MLQGVGNGPASMENSLSVSRQVKQMLYDPAVTVLGIYPRERKASTSRPHRDLYTSVYGCFIRRNQTLETTRCPSTGRWTKQLWHTRTTECCLTLKMKELWMCPATWTKQFCSTEKPDQKKKKNILYASIYRKV